VKRFRTAPHKLYAMAGTKRGPRFLIVLQVWDTIAKTAQPKALFRHTPRFNVRVKPSNVRPSPNWPRALSWRRSHESRFPPKANCRLTIPLLRTCCVVQGSEFADAEDRLSKRYARSTISTVTGRKRKR